MASARFSLLAIVALIGLSLVSAERIRKAIYLPITQGGHFCFRRANGTHQFGCSSEKNGNVGVVHLLENEADFEWVLKKGNAAPYIAMMKKGQFGFDNLKRLEDSGDRVSGVILLEELSKDNKTETPEKFSSDDFCPNSQSSLYANRPGDSSSSHCSAAKPWNPAATGIASHNWKFPIIYIKDRVTVANLTRDCYDKYNKVAADGVTPPSWPLCAVELDSFMNQAVSSKSCVRRQNILNPFSPTRWCDPLGDQSAFMLQSPMSTNDTQSEFFPENSVIVVSTRLDTLGLFDHLELGSESPATGIVVLLSVAKILNGMNPIDYADSGTQNILFAFLNGESFDYIGSSKMLYDMENGKFPCTSNSGKSNDENCKKVAEMKEQLPKIKPSSIKSYLELGQLYSPDPVTSSELYAHVDTKFKDERLIDDLKNSFQGSVKVERASDPSRGLPPSSLHTLLRARNDTPAVLLTNFDQQMTNKFYHSLYDNYVNMGLYDHALGTDQDIVEKLAVVSESVASHLFFQATGGRASFKDQMNRTLVNEMLNCFLNTSRCGLFTRASTPNLPPQEGIGPVGPYTQYVQVITSYNIHTFIVQRLLTYLTGEKVEETEGKFTKENCTAPSDQNVFRYFFIRGDFDGANCTVRLNGTTNDSLPDTCGVCTRTTSWLSLAKSPAFIVKDYDLSNGTYGAWTESVWASLSGRIFLKADPALENGYLACGIIVLVVSVLVVLWIDKFSDEIFPSQLPAAAAAAQQPAAAVAAGVPASSRLDENGAVVTTTSNTSVRESARL